MGRKVREPLKPAVSVADAPRGGTLVPPDEAPRKKGRPSKADLAEREAQAAAQAQALKERAAIPKEEMRPVMMIALGLFAKGIKGEPPTEQEVELCTGPAHAVAVKYGFNLDRFPEIALLGALVIVGQNMRERRKAEEKREERNRGDTRAEGCDRIERCIRRSHPR